MEDIKDGKVDVLDEVVMLVMFGLFLSHTSSWNPPRRPPPKHHPFSIRDNQKDVFIPSNRDEQIYVYVYSAKLDNFQIKTPRRRLQLFQRKGRSNSSQG